MRTYIHIHTRKSTHTHSYTCTHSCTLMHTHSYMHTHSKYYRFTTIDHEYTQCRYKHIHRAHTNTYLHANNHHTLHIKLILIEYNLHIHIHSKYTRIYAYKQRNIYTAHKQHTSKNTHIKHAQAQQTHTHTHT